MKALVYDRYGPPDVLRICELPKPEPGPGQVLVHVHAIPVGPGDCKLRAGELRHHFEVSFPNIPGRYASGVVTAIGAGIDKPTIGDEVVLAILHGDGGTAAEYVLTTPRQLTLKPLNIGHVETAALIQGAVTAWAAIMEAGQVVAGTRLLVHGAAGAVGSACVELAIHAGAIVSATCRYTDRQFVRSLGATEIYAFDEPEDVERASSQEVVIDTIGGDVHALSYRMLRRGGRLVTLNALPIVKRGAEHGVEVIGARIDDRAEILDTVARLAERGVLRPRVALVQPLEGAILAHTIVERGSSRPGRVVLRLTDTIA